MGWGGGTRNVQGAPIYTCLFTNEYVQPTDFTFITHIMYIPIDVSIHIIIFHVCKYTVYVYFKNLKSTPYSNQCINLPLQKISVQEGSLPMEKDDVQGQHPFRTS